MKKNALIQLFFDKKLIEKQGNLYKADRAFKAYSLIQMCFNEHDLKRIHKYVHIFDNFIAGAIDIEIKDGRIIISEVHGEETIIKAENDKEI